MIEQLFERTEHPFQRTKIEIFSDGNDDYTYVLPDYYADSCINYAQLVKIREKGMLDWYESPNVSILLYWNFINEFKRRTSPAMLEGLTDHLWIWHEFFYFSLTIPD